MDQCARTRGRDMARSLPSEDTAEGSPLQASKRTHGNLTLLATLTSDFRPLAVRNTLDGEVTQSVVLPCAS